METPKRYLVVTKGSDGSMQIHKMKQWLRAHPDEVPPGMHPYDSTSRQLKAGLKKRGWTVNETEEEVRMIPPDLTGDADTVSMLGESGEEENVPETDDRFEFSLESHLRDFLARNLGTINVHSSRLRLYSDGSGRTGVEFPTDVGPIDILAVDESGNLFVFELKLSRGPDRAMGQLARYMGWVKKTLAGQKEVFGIIVAKNMDEKLRYASLAVPNVKLWEYEVKFQLTPADLGA